MANATAGSINMCEIRGCDLVSDERRSFLVGSGASLLAIAAGAPVVANQTQTPPTRVLDDQTIPHSKLTFKSGTKEIDGSPDGTFPCASRLNSPMRNVESCGMTNGQCSLT